MIAPARGEPSRHCVLPESRIPDPYVDRNEYDVAWVDDKRWTYRSEFTTPSNLQHNTRVALVFEGLDTFATVHLNDTVVLQSDNMFISYRVDVTKLVRPDVQNKLSIDFEPAALRGKDIVQAHPEHRFLASLCSPERLAVRKAQYHWGWDWGPACASAGPWRPVRLETYTSRIDDVAIQHTLEDDLKSCRAVVSAKIDGHTPGAKVKITLRSPEEDVVFGTTLPVDADGSTSVEFTLSNPQLWYPFGYGKQPLYYLSAELVLDDDSIHLVTKRTSFRRAELIQEADKFGKSFYFRVNNIDVFAGGSCWIPADSFLPRLSQGDYREWLELMVEGNQIMTRLVSLLCYFTLEFN